MDPDNKSTPIWFNTLRDETRGQSAPKYVSIIFPCECSPLSGLTQNPYGTWVHGNKVSA